MNSKTLKIKPLVLQTADEYREAQPFILSSKKKNTGRPTVMTNEVVRKLEQAFAHDCTVEEACLYAGISRETYYAFCRKRPDFSDRITLLRHTAILVARRTIIEALPHNPALAMKYLERKRPQEFSLRATITHQIPTHSNYKVEAEQVEAIENIVALFEKKARDVESAYVVSDI